MKNLLISLTATGFALFAFSSNAQQVGRADPFFADGGSYDPSCLLYTSPSPRDATLSRMPSSA